MAAQPNLSTILNTAHVAQYLARNDQSEQLVLKGGTLDLSLGVKIYMERMAVQWLYSVNPNADTLQNTGNYLWAILGKYKKEALDIVTNMQQAPPTVSGPSDLTVTEGATASFGLVVTSNLPYTVQWYRNNTLVPGVSGASYSYTTALSNNNDKVFAIVDNGVGQVQSRTATLLVGATLQGQYWFGDTDYFAALNAGNDTITYSGNFNITNLQPLSVPFPIGAANNKFEVIRYPISQGPKSLWFSTQLNNGQIPDSVFRDIITIGSNLYIVSRNAISIDTTVPMIFS